ncbi:hypothetical protein, partial [Desulfobacula sp.]|uniref:hypothetical protein n=1 Tax=Desulfobacula sp. TaxID=2593537 RepID=UPI0039B9192D
MTKKFFSGTFEHNFISGDTSCFTVISFLGSECCQVRVHSKINYQFLELSRLSGKAWKLRHIKYMSCFHNSAGQDES